MMASDCFTQVGVVSVHRVPADDRASFPFAADSCFTIHMVVFGKFSLFSLGYHRLL